MNDSFGTIRIPKHLCVSKSTFRDSLNIIRGFLLLFVICFYKGYLDQDKIKVH